MLVVCISSLGKCAFKSFSYFKSWVTFWWLLLSFRNFSKIYSGNSLVVQWVKDSALSLQWLGLLLWHGFSPWPGTFYILQAQPNIWVCVCVYTHSQILYIYIFWILIPHQAHDLQILFFHSIACLFTLLIVSNIKLEYDYNKNLQGQDFKFPEDYRKQIHSSYKQDYF